MSELEYALPKSNASARIYTKEIALLRSGETITMAWNLELKKVVLLGDADY